MLHIDLITQAPSSAGNAIILPVESWDLAKSLWPELKTLNESDWPTAGQWRLLNAGAGSAWILLNVDWNKASSAGSLKAALKELEAHKFESATFYHTGTALQLRARVWQAADSAYLLEEFLAKKKGFHFKNLHFLIPESTPQMRKECAIGQHIAAAIKTTKTLAEMPANHCTPAYMAEQAQKIAEKSSLISAEILGYEAIKDLGMNSFLSVAQGSAHEPRFIIMKYLPEGKSDNPLVFVGKGITFDTGGHSLKPANSMMGMKFDMSGGATVLGIFEFLAQSKISTPIIGLVPCCENIPGGMANKPDDVITSMSGQTIEVLNTDAEGRLILCDALTYAERFTPRYVVDIATLTGSCMATFGGVASGLMGNSQELIDELKKASERSGDKVWQLPLGEEWHDELKSPIADMANIGSKYSGAITAGCFLEKFSGAYQWAHLDIAGTACSTHGPKRGATGRPVPLLLDFVLHQDKG